MSLFKKIVAAVIETVRTNRAPRWAAEPLRIYANRAIGFVATVTGALVVVNQMTALLPVSVRGEVSAVAGAAGVACVLVTKVLTELARSKVFSPATVAAPGFVPPVPPAA